MFLSQPEFAVEGLLAESHFDQRFGGLLCLQLDPLDLTVASIMSLDYECHAAYLELVPVRTLTCCVMGRLMTDNADQSDSDYR